MSAYYHRNIRKKYRQYTEHCTALNFVVISELAFYVTDFFSKFGNQNLTKWEEKQDRQDVTVMEIENNVQYTSKQYKLIRVAASFQFQGKEKQTHTIKRKIVKKKKKKESEMPEKNSRSESQLEMENGLIITQYRQNTSTIN